MKIPTRQIPTRQVETEWGVLYADATGGGTVRFSTNSVNPNNPTRHLTINERPYTCDIELSLQKATTGRVYVDDIWHFDIHDAFRHLRHHPSRARAPITPHIALQRDIAPALAEWLYSPEGVSLLEDGDTYRHTERVADQASAEQVLKAALERVQRLRDPIHAGHSIHPDDEEFLRYLNTSFRDEIAPDTPAPEPLATPPTPRSSPSPDVPGL